MRFSYRMVPEVYRLFWAAMARGEFITDAAVEAGTYRKQGTRWLVAAGGVRPRRGRGLKGRCLTLAQREEIALGRARGQSVRSIAAAIGCSPSGLQQPDGVMVSHNATSVPPVSICAPAPVTLLSGTN
jgi:hypothetical protein